MTTIIFSWFVYNIYLVMHIVYVPREGVVASTIRILGAKFRSWANFPWFFQKNIRPNSIA
jgi:hypothetical protein